MPLTPASPTMPIANPAARPEKPTAKPAPKWVKPLTSRTKISSLITESFLPQATSVLQNIFYQSIYNKR